MAAAQLNASMSQFHGVIDPDNDRRLDVSHNPVDTDAVRGRKLQHRGAANVFWPADINIDDLADAPRDFLSSTSREVHPRDR